MKTRTILRANLSLRYKHNNEGIQCNLMDLASNSQPLEPHDVVDGIVAEV